MELKLNSSMIKMILHIHQNGYVTKSTRPFLNNFKYYNYLWLLRDMNIIRCEKTNIENHQKKWIFTEKGQKVADMLYNIKELIENEN